MSSSDDDDCWSDRSSDGVDDAMLAMTAREWAARAECVHVQARDGRECLRYAPCPGLRLVEEIGSRRRYFRLRLQQRSWPRYLAHAETDEVECRAGAHARQPGHAACACGRYAYIRLCDATKPVARAVLRRAGVVFRAIAPKTPRAQRAQRAQRAPKAPKAPEAHKAPKAHKAPQAPEAPKAPEAPQAPKRARAPEAQRAPKRARALEAPKAQKA